jgi:hypothetical protein
MAGVNAAIGEFAPRSYMSGDDFYTGPYHNKKMPPFSVEMAPKEKVTIQAPWQVPRSGEKLYDASAERAIQKQVSSTMLANQKIIVRFYKRGVFQGYVIEPAVWYFGAIFFSHNIGVSPNQ